MTTSATETVFEILEGRVRFTVTFYIGKGYLNADCDCPAAKYGNFCRHRIALLRGDTSHLASKNIEELEAVLLHLPGTRLESALQRFDASASKVTELRESGTPEELEAAELDFKAARKNLSIMMMM